jgi:hypothetical protein
VIDEREIVRRAVEALDPPEPAFERLRHRRDRKRRNQRIKAGVVGIAVFVAAVWIVTSVSSLDRSETTVVPAGEPVPIGTVTQSGAGCALEIDTDPIPPGFTLSLVNETNRPVSFELFRLRSRSSFAQLQAFVEAFDAGHETWPPALHGRITPGPVAQAWRITGGAFLRRSWFERTLGPGGSGTSTNNFTSGDAIAVVCLDEHSTPGVVQGLIYAPFAVVGPIVVP